MVRGGFPFILYNHQSKPPTKGYRLLGSPCYGSESVFDKHVADFSNLQTRNKESTNKGSSWAFACYTPRSMSSGYNLPTHASWPNLGKPRKLTRRKKFQGVLQFLQVDKYVQKGTPISFSANSQFPGPRAGAAGPQRPCQHPRASVQGRWKETTPTHAQKNTHVCVCVCSSTCV